MINKKYLTWLNKYIDESFENKTIFISGGHSGIGYEVSRYSLHYKMNIIWGSRNLEKANEAKEKILKEFPNGNVSIFQLDLADFVSIKNFVQNIIDKNIKIDYFYNNAGVYRMNKSHTKDGLDLTIGTNFIGTYLLSKLMLDYFIKSKQQTKFLFTTSVMAYLKKIDYDDFLLEKKYGKIKAYCISKREVIHMCHFFMEKYPDYVFNLVHPGSTYTPLINKGYKNNFMQKAGKIFMKIFFHSADKAALSTIISLSKDSNHNMVCPRGLFNLSGYPKPKKIKKSLTNGYSKTMEMTNAIVFK